MRKKIVVKLNMASSIDGKINTIEKDKLTLGSQEDRNLMEKLRAEADCIIIGANNVKIEDTPLIIRNNKLIKFREKVKGSTQPVNVVISSKLDFDFKTSAFFNFVDTKKMIFTSKNINKILEKKADRYANVVKLNCKHEKINVIDVINYLKNKLKYKNILVEGGGELNFSMLSQNLIDEIYITLCPFIFGGTNTLSIVAGHGFNKYNIKKVKLLSIKKGKFGELFLHYLVLKKKVKIKNNQFSKKGARIFY